MPAKPKVPKTLSRFKIDGAEFEIDVAKLTMGEIADVEAHFDRDIDDLRTGQDILARLYLSMRRKKPTTSWADVSALTSDRFEVVEATRPTSAPATSGTPAT